MSFLGHRITTDGSFAIESHILDGEVLCMERADIRFISYLRENKKFTSLKALQIAIQKDIFSAQKELQLYS